jgi:hypothetical protein
MMVLYPMARRRRLMSQRRPMAHGLALTMLLSEA